MPHQACVRAAARKLLHGYRRSGARNVKVGLLNQRGYERCHPARGAEDTVHVRAGSAKHAACAAASFVAAVIALCTRPP